MERKIGLFIAMSFCYGLVCMLWPHEQLTLVFCDVGQGDATLIQFGNFQALIDGGPDEKVLTCLGEHMPFFDRTVELVVATHQDSDHIGGLPTIFANYRVARLAWNGEERQTTVFQTFNQAIQTEQSEGMISFVPTHGHQTYLGSSLALTYWFPRVASRPKGTRISPQCEILLQDNMTDLTTQNNESNDGSIVLFIRYKQITILLMGDLELKGELTLDCLNLLSHTRLVKVGHHGSKSSSSQVFVDKTQPEYAVFSVGKNNRFGHPTPEVMSRYDLFGSMLLRTDLSGTLVFLSDGDRVWRKKSSFTVLTP